jgi:hypothetical protein
MPRIFSFALEYLFRSVPVLQSSFLTSLLSSVPNYFNADPVCGILKVRKSEFLESRALDNEEENYFTESTELGTILLSLMTFLSWILQPFR